MENETRIMTSEEYLTHIGYGVIEFIKEANFKDFIDEIDEIDSITKPNRKSEIYNTYGAENTINDYLIIRENGKYEIQFKTEKNYTIMLKIGKYEERVKPERVDNSGYIEQFKYNMFMKAVDRLSRPNTQLNHWNYWDDVAKLKKVYNIK